VAASVFVLGDRAFAMLLRRLRIVAGDTRPSVPQAVYFDNFRSDSSMRKLQIGTSLELER
jgi:hypothetical protein